MKQLDIFSILEEQSSALQEVEVLHTKTPIAKAVGVEISRNLFVLTNEHFNGLTTGIAKAQANCDAIEIALKAEQATDEEKNKLAAYTGWGGLSSVFGDDSKQAAKFGEFIRTNLSDAWYQQAKESVLSAYYTHPNVCRAVWRALEWMGFKGGNVLEPSCGTGNFIGTMPTDMRLASSIHAVEKDATTSRIAHKLYGDRKTKVHNMGFEKTNFRSNSFDVVIGNVPFGNFRLHDQKFNHLKMPIHDYFIAKSIDLVRPGGLVALITSTGTLEKESLSSREYYAQMADLVTAVRLPSGAFQDLGATNVATDILIFRKKDETSFKSGQFVNKVLMGNSINCSHSVRNETINGYFARNPSHLLGRPILTAGKFGATIEYTPHENWEVKLGTVLAEEELQGIYMPAIYSEADAAIVNVPTGTLTSGFFVDDDGQLQYMDGNTPESQTHLPMVTRQRIIAITKIRDLAVELIEFESMGKDGGGLRNALNRAYDAFVKDYGYLMNPTNRRLFGSDSRSPLVWALESYDEENDLAVKSDLFTKVTVGQATLSDTAETISDAIALSYNKFGKLNIEFMAGALGWSIKTLVDALTAENRVFEDPETGDWIDSEVYLSGNVRVKLGLAESALTNAPRFEKNVIALRNVVPATVKLEDVGIQLGVTWIDAGVVKNFVKEVVLEGSSDSFQIEHIPALAKWSVTCSSWASKSVNFTSVWGTARKSFDSILESLLNQRAPEVYDVVMVEGREKRLINPDETLAAREKGDQLQKKFSDWVLADENRSARLEEVYNNLFNSTVNRVYNGSHLVIPGLNCNITLRDAQKDSVWRGIVSGNTLYALDVGGGKTLIQICVAQECKRLGIASKPMLVVPNHMLEAFAGEYIRAFPKARILAASKSDLEGEKRRRLLSRIATGNWDCIIITHSSFSKLSLSKESIAQHTKKVCSIVEEGLAGCKDKTAVREAERSKKCIEAKLEGLASRCKRDDGILAFEQLGVDLICVDEADLFKNLWFFTQKRRVSGINTAFSARALDLYIKSSVLQEKRGNDGFGLIFATATPISNSIGELFVMQTYLQSQRLRESNIDCFDAWSANFAREVMSIEVKPEGSGYRMHNRFARFVNVPELMLMFREVAEIRTKAMLKLPEPKLVGGKHIIVAEEPSPAQKAYVGELAVRAEKIRSGIVRPNEDNMLCVTNDGRKAALDMRTIDGALADYAGSKVNACISNVLHHFKEGAHKKLTQLVFCDLSTPKQHAFSVYAHVRDKLIEAGVPDDQIAFAQDYDTDTKKAKLHRKVRTGAIRVLIGSTELMGFGTNVQNLLIAEHHLDAPWRPRDVAQRDGRIIRQGNENEEVYIYRYVTEGTFDAYGWQTLERKASFIAQVMDGTSQARSVEDVSSQSLSYAEVKALASGNPLVIEKAGVDSEVAKLYAIKTTWHNDRTSMRHKLASAELNLDYYVKRLTKLETDGVANTLVIDGVEYLATDSSSKKLQGTLTQIKAASLDVTKWRKVVKTEIYFGNWQLVLTIEGKIGDSRTTASVVHKTTAMSLDIQLPFGAENLLEFMVNDGIAQALKKEVLDIGERIDGYRKFIEDATFQLQKPFEYEQRFNAALQRQIEIDSQLDIGNNEKSAVGLTNDDSEENCAVLPKTPPKIDNLLKETA